MREPRAISWKNDCTWTYPCAHCDFAESLRIENPFQAPPSVSISHRVFALRCHAFSITRELDAGSSQRGTQTSGQTPLETRRRTKRASERASTRGYTAFQILSRLEQQCVGNAPHKRRKRHSRALSLPFFPRTPIFSSLRPSSLSLSLSLSPPL